MSTFTVTEREPVRLTPDNPATVIPGPTGDAPAWRPARRPDPNAWPSPEDFDTPADPEPAPAARLEPPRAPFEPPAAQPSPLPPDPPQQGGQVATLGNADPAVTGDGINGAELLGYIAGYMGQYVAFPSMAAHVTAILWTGHAVARDRDDTGMGPLIWRASPRLLVTSAENKSGKSTLLDLIVYLTRCRSGRIPKTTPAALAHILGTKQDVAVLDEGKLIFGAGAKNQDLQAILLAGYTRRAPYTAMYGSKIREVNVFGPVAVAGRDDLITDTSGQLLDLLDRCITIRMQRPERPKREADERAEDDGELLGVSLQMWADENRDALKEAARAIAEADYETGRDADEAPGESSLRRPQIWRPLLAVADVAGGPWPHLARQAMVTLSAGAPVIEAASAMDVVRERAAGWAAPEFVTGQDGAS